MGTEFVPLIYSTTNVALRKRDQGKQTSFFLDFTVNGKRTKEYLQLYLEENNPMKEQKESNKKKKEAANKIRLDGIAGALFDTKIFITKEDVLSSLS